MAMVGSHDTSLVCSTRWSRGGHVTSTTTAAGLLWVDARARHTLGCCCACMPPERQITLKELRKNHLRGSCCVKLGLFSRGASVGLQLSNEVVRPSNKLQRRVSRCLLLCLTQTDNRLGTSSLYSPRRLERRTQFSIRTNLDEHDGAQRGAPRENNN